MLLHRQHERGPRVFEFTYSLMDIAIDNNAALCFRCNLGLTARAAIPFLAALRGRNMSYKTLVLSKASARRESPIGDL